MSPVNSQHALAPKLLSPLQVLGKAVDVKLWEPHRRVIFQPGVWPPLAIAQFAKRLVNRIPPYLVVECRKDDIFRQRAVESGKGRDYTRPCCVAAARGTGRRRARRGDLFRLRRLLFQAAFGVSPLDYLSTRRLLLGFAFAVVVLVAAVHAALALAWWLWGAVHVAFLAQLRSRVSVAISWFWAYLTFRRGTRLVTGGDG